MTFGDDKSDFENIYGKLRLKKESTFGWPKTYKFINKIQGTSYIVQPNVEAENYYDVLNRDFDACIECDNDLLCPFWVNDQSKDESLFPLCVDESIFNDYCRIIYHCIKYSVNNTILFLPKFSETCEEIVAGVISYKKFLKLLNEKKVLCGICYIITL